MNSGAGERFSLIKRAYCPHRLPELGSQHSWDPSQPPVFPALGIRGLLLTFVGACTHDHIQTHTSSKYILETTLNLPLSYGKLILILYLWGLEKGHVEQGTGTLEGPVPQGRVVTGHRAVPWEVTEKPAPWRGDAGGFKTPCQTQFSSIYLLPMNKLSAINYCSSTMPAQCHSFTMMIMKPPSYPKLSRSPNKWFMLSYLVMVSLFHNGK